jgi:hypothetical protein
LLIQCYRHGAFKAGAPTEELLRILTQLNYRLAYVPWNGAKEELQAIEVTQVPELDSFLLYAVPEGVASPRSDGASGATVAEVARAG